MKKLLIIKLKAKENNNIKNINKEYNKLIMNILLPAQMFHKKY